MKKTLPLPDHHGFELRLPARVALAPGASAHPDATGFSIVKNNTRITATVPARAAEKMGNLLGSAAGMPTDGLADSWRQLIQTFGSAGMLVASGTTPESGATPALDFVAAMKDRIYAHTATAFPEGHRFDRFLRGDLRGKARRWLIENYRYTRSARYHIAPVLQHIHTEFERGVWERFLAEESWHWKIYRPAFSELGVDMSEIDSYQMDPGTEHFIETLHGISTRSPVDYAAAMTFIEEPPLAEAMDDDQLSVALMRHHGLSVKAVRPLWWHATENRAAGHSALGPILLSHRGSLRAAEVDGALDAMTKTIDAVSNWQHSILGDSVDDTTADRAKSEAR
jgi:pyrroloquinoline quinone (PQQ) biosynthesis protein C